MANQWLPRLGTTTRAWLIHQQQIKRHLTNPDRLFWWHWGSKIRCILGFRKLIYFVRISLVFFCFLFFFFRINEWSCFNAVLMLGVLGEGIQLKACHRVHLFHWQELSCSWDTWHAEHQLINSLKMKLSVTITSHQQLWERCPGEPGEDPAPLLVQEQPPHPGAIHSPCVGSAQRLLADILEIFPLCLQPRRGQIRLWHAG